MSLPPPAPTLFPYTTLFRSGARARYPNAPPARARVPPYPCGQRRQFVSLNLENHKGPTLPELGSWPHWAVFANQDRKSTRLNSSHVAISYAVFCLKKKNTTV